MFLDGQTVQNPAVSRVAGSGQVSNQLDQKIGGSHAFNIASGSLFCRDKGHALSERR